VIKLFVCLFVFSRFMSLSVDPRPRPKWPRSGAPLQKKKFHLMIEKILVDIILAKMQN